MFLRVESFLETSIFGNNFCSSFFFYAEKLSIIYNTICLYFLFWGYFQFEAVMNKDARNIFGYISYVPMFLFVMGKYLGI